MNMHELTIEHANYLLRTKQISPEELVNEFYKIILKVDLKF